MKRKKIFLLLIALIVLLLGAVYIVGKKFVANKNRMEETQMRTTYEDGAGWIYVCSQPIEVKDQDVKYMNGVPSLTPVNKLDAEKYCHRTGIE